MVFRPLRGGKPGGATEVTYGGAVRRDFREVSRVGATNVGKLAGDWRPLAMRPLGAIYGIYLYSCIYYIYILYMYRC